MKTDDEVKVQKAKMRTRNKGGRKTTEQAKVHVAPEQLSGKGERIR